jgi:hypothetical protein
VSGKGWPCSFRHASLSALFENYSTAADQVHRAAYLAAADCASAILDTPCSPFYLMVIPAVGELLAGMVMLKAGFGKACAWTGLITGVVCILPDGLLSAADGYRVGAAPHTLRHRLMLQLLKQCAVKGAGLQRVKLPGSGRQGCKSRKVEVLLPSFA